MYYLENSDEESVYDKHLTYKVRKGDTLQSVADELGIDSQELRRYHNIYCPLPDLIEADFKSYLKFVILASEETKAKVKEEILKKPKKVIFGNDYKIPFLSEKSTKTYKAKYTTVAGSAVDVIEMTIGVKWLATDKNKYHLFEINREKEIYVNGSPPDSVIQELEAKTAEVLYPLKIVVDEFGKWVDIYNYDEIESRWPKIKREVLDYYEGEVAETYMEQTEYALENSDTLLESLRSDYFLRTFFNGIHVGYTGVYSFETEVSFPLEKDEESVFKVKQKIDAVLDDNDLIRIEQKGDYVDTGYDVIYGYAPWKGNFSSVYFLNPDSYNIEKLNAQCNIEYDEPIKATIEIELVKKEENQDN
ncbi:LysM peptidoglycan-binding domain-containing protein [Flavobacterium hungaricum]|uniref:LysM peptidoglycan-binding domain-containing protein n=1 Tax=Flavobacterium hungaricum TaxID=2082725 RepID=A0ABR9TFR5_9FLAO|nr:LysM peptidoglycan-binding domain-containing protein [Flavobacterium hungaricum]MBE8723874.1 LysM peptidoglycan-binding domain-containing protein [Flavobacterium hungaricum]